MHIVPSDHLTLGWVQLPLPTGPPSPHQAHSVHVVVAMNHSEPYPLPYLAISIALDLTEIGCSASVRLVEKAQMVKH